MNLRPLVPALLALASTAQQPTDPKTDPKAEPNAAPGAGGSKAAPADASPSGSPSSAAAPRRFASTPVPDAPPLDVASASRVAVGVLLELQQTEGGGDEWPYRGVYREDANVSPLGYRVGGTAIACLGLAATPGAAADEGRRRAIERGVRFVLDALELPRMQDDFVGAYDVRGWGHAYALECLLTLRDRDLVPPKLVAAVDARCKWLVDTLVASAIPGAGGWNYSRPRGYRSPLNRASTFMTAPTLQALFHAQARGLQVPDSVVTQALDALERARAKPGGYAYGAPAEAQGDVDEAALSMMDKTPSAAARATVVETTLLLAGRGDLARLERAVERFFEHWDDLAVRKSQLGTHIPPYGIAPYYFLFGHVYCAQAIEMLPDPARRDALRGRLFAVLAKSREDDGSWNDRQFARSAGYGTAFALLALHAKDLPPPARWQRGEAGGKPADK